MLKRERQNEIVLYVNKHRFAKIEQLAALVNTSSITIRRDLQELHNMQRLVKVHGGAMAITAETVKIDMAVKSREQEHMEEKKKIAEYASRYIVQGSYIYLDAGTSTALLIPYLEGKDVTVYTHGVHHMHQLVFHNITTHIIGGLLKESTLATVGEVTTYYIKTLNFDIAFIGANAVDADFGYSTPDETEAIIKRQIINQSKQSYVLADKSKLFAKSYVSFAKFEEATLITEEGKQNKL